MLGDSGDSGTRITAVSALIALVFFRARGRRDKTVRR
jgi:hypothetical protein